MHRVFVALFCIVFVVGINGASIEMPTTVDEDAIEMARLTEKFWSLKPAILKKVDPLIYCQVIDQCCENEHRSQAASLFVPFALDNSDENQFLEAINACVNSTASHNTNQWCSSYQKEIISYWVAEKDPDVTNYVSLASECLENVDKIFDRIFSLCNDKEVHALICSSSKKLVETCVGKLLQGLNDDDDEAYPEYLVKAKQALINSNQKLS